MQALSKTQPLSKQWIERHYADFNKLLSTRCWGSATTFAGASINPQTGLCTLLSVGDSRIYVIDKEDNWHLMTQDHNMLSELKPDLDEDDKQHYASLYAGLTSCFVADGAPFSGEITLKQYQLKAGETLLICTDGLTDYTTKAIRQGIWSGFPTWNKSLDYKACGWLERIHTFFGEKRQIYDDISVVCFYYQPDANSGVINI
ncbi:SpoIIE family protein phosphatase [Pasteurellaceae bacterium 20609_3]|uniref:PP2C family protein-serine/threonine phosphatase n=1 Tax=Spirabiliibacterium mucosae TaxID=28156 RepID=UPI001AAC9C3C|nr:SpoIIE family protein phosphatase [Spirabiliibacterium mucosae]MBE2898465.1 SpoIIE family protein phosphatase [Spirabiliibacterium mucosae]